MSWEAQTETNPMYHLSTVSILPSLPGQFQWTSLIPHTHNSSYAFTHCLAPRFSILHCWARFSSLNRRASLIKTFSCKQERGFGNWHASRTKIRPLCRRMVSMPWQQSIESKAPYSAATNSLSTIREHCSPPITCRSSNMPLEAEEAGLHPSQFLPPSFTWSPPSRHSLESVSMWHRE